MWNVCVCKINLALRLLTCLIAHVFPRKGTGADTTPLTPVSVEGSIFRQTAGCVSMT